MTKRWVLSLLACMVLALASTAAYGQAVFGNIVGTANDPQGAAVANVKVIVTSTTKDTSVTTTTNDSGNYSVTHLIPDIYKIRFESAGFKTFEQGNVPVSADGTQRVDVQFTVGATSETMEVTGEPPQLQTDKSDIAVEFNSTYVSEMPTLNRNFTQFELMSPGTQKLTGWSHANTENPQGSQQIFVNGQHFSGTNYQLDGTDNQDPILGIIVINPNLDGISEAKIALQQYDAEMGKAVAGYVTTQTKSGSNDFHGSAFWFRRTDANQARDPFSQFAPNPSTGKFIPSSKWQQFGGSIGGPIIKNKLFFFADYQGTRQSTGITNTYSIPTALVESTCGATTGNCDLSQYAGNTGGGGNANVAQGQVYDPNTGALNGSGRTSFGDCIHGINCNLIPNSMISPQARAILAWFPAPNTAGQSNGTQNNYIAGGSGPFTQNAFDTREDWVATPTLNVFGRYSQSYFSVSGLPGLGQAGGLGFGSGGLAGNSIIHNYSLAIGATKTFSQTWLADFRFGWFKYNPQTHKAFAGATPMNTINAPGLNITNQGAETALFTSGLPAFNGDGTLTPFGEGLNVGRCNCPLVENESQYQGVANFTKIWGNHSFKFGTDIRSASNLRVPSDANRTGVLNFSHLNTSGGDPTIPTSNSLGGLDLATFLLGDVSSFNRFVSTSLDAAEHQWRFFFYGQDTWRITPKLTLNYGLRWDIYSPETVNAKGNGGFANPQQGIIRVAGYGPYGLSGNIANDMHAFAPRLGLAYSMNEKTVIRMGFGISYDIGVFGSNFGHAVTQNLPVLANQQITASTTIPGATDNVITAFNLAVGPAGNIFPAIPTSGILPLGGPQGNVQPRMRPEKQVLPAIGAFNVAIQRQLTNSMTLDIAYVGNIGRHGFDGDGPSYNLNPVEITNWAATQLPPGSPGFISQSQRQPYFNRFSYPGYIDPSTGQTLMCCSGGIMGNYFGNDANSSYNALQVKVQNQMSHGLQFIAHYTWSRALNYNSGYYAIDPRYAYGPDDQNRGQVFVLNLVYQLPFGKGKQFGGNAGKLENAFIGGWQFTSTTNYSAGLPFTPSFNECSSVNDVGVCVPNKGNLANWSMGGGGYNNQTHTVTFFTPQPLGNAWLEPSPGTLGDAGNFSLVGARSFTTDASIMKDFGLTERFKLQFRMDMFNLFNHPVLGFNGNQGNFCVDCINNGKVFNNAGVVTSLDGNVVMRELQFALRLTF
jgi:hypothetical protein